MVKEITAMNSVIKVVFYILIFVGASQIVGGSIGVYEVTSGSMEPKLSVGDHIVVKEFQVTHPVDNGTIIVFKDPESSRFIVHRAIYYTEKGEDWTKSVDRSFFFDDKKPECSEIQYCPAPNDGYITYGDNNFGIDQETDAFGPVPKENVKGEVVWVITDKKLSVDYWENSISF